MKDNRQHHLLWTFVAVNVAAVQLPCIYIDSLIVSIGREAAWSHIPIETVVELHCMSREIPLQSRWIQDEMAGSGLWSTSPHSSK